MLAGSGRIFKTEEKSSPEDGKLELGSEVAGREDRTHAV